MLIGFAVGLVIVGAAIIARHCARSYANSRLSAARSRTRDAINRADVAAKAAREEVRYYAEKRSAELQIIIDAMRVELASNETFYAEAYTAISNYINNITPFDKAYLKIKALKAQIQFTLALRDQIDLAIDQDAKEQEQIEQAIKILRKTDNVELRLDLIEIHYPELGRMLVFARGKVDKMRQVIKDWKLSSPVTEHCALDNLLSILDQQSAAAEEIANLNWALANINQRKQSFYRRRNKIISEIKTMHINRSKAMHELKATFPEAERAVKLLLAFADTQVRTVQNNLRNTHNLKNAYSLELNSLFEQIKVFNNEIKEVRETSKSSMFDHPRFVALKRKRETLKEQIPVVKKQKIDCTTLIQQYKEERDLWRKRREYVENFFVENNQQHLAPDFVKRLINKYCEPSQNLKIGINHR